MEAAEARPRKGLAGAMTGMPRLRSSELTPIQAAASAKRAVDEDDGHRVGRGRGGRPRRDRREVVRHENRSSAICAIASPPERPRGTSCAPA
ncbi:hypothetical protein GCM10010383_68110 [Streptomyces lomondensis]|uniref:Uncharacterized protein n=1 Tax=Streptomyces lomondensis TaxID=68229 RepID=A0ABQ2XQ98_9ACTN|nr:hypothetical protein GCM10010383_68110 [Streptomyces lomondensis]